jgi:hypothetical protein
MIKKRVRAIKARSTETLDSAVTEILHPNTPDNARAWFRLCAARLQAKGKDWHVPGMPALAGILAAADPVLKGAGPLRP